MGNSSFKPLWVIFCVVLALVTIGLLRGRLGPSEAVAWTTDPASGLDRASKEGKPVLLYFTASWCPPCQQMKSTTFASIDVAQALSDCVAIKVDVDSNRQMAQQHNVTSIPLMKLVSSDGKLIRQRAGYMDPDQFILWLKGS